LKKNYGLKIKYKFLANVTPREPMVQPTRSSRLASYSRHIKDFFIDYFYFEDFDINDFIHIDLFESLFYVLKVVLSDRYLRDRILKNKNKNDDI